MPEPMNDHDLLITMNAKLDTVLARDADQEKRLRLLEGYGLSSLPQRVTALEQVRWKASGGIALVASLMSSGLVAGIIEVTSQR